MALCRGQTPRSVPSGRSPSAFVKDVFWKFLSQGVSFAFQLATTIALARLLTPRDYGLAAMVLVFGRLVMIFSDFALTPALVQRPVLTDKDRSTAFWTTIGLGTGSTIVGIAISGAIASLYGQPEVQPLFIAFSFSFLLLSLRVRRRLRC